jgi:hypothetical protein
MVGLESFVMVWGVNPEGLPVERGWGRHGPAVDRDDGTPRAKIT